MYKKSVCATEYKFHHHNKDRSVNVEQENNHSLFVVSIRRNKYPETQSVGKMQSSKC
jgi:hypothetical protein